MTQPSEPQDPSEQPLTPPAPGAPSPAGGFPPAQPPAPPVWPPAPPAGAGLPPAPPPTWTGYAGYGTTAPASGAWQQQSATPRTSSNAIAALILAIVSWALCPIIPAIVALVLANSASREISSSGGMVTGSGLVTGARITSWINIGFWSVMLIFGILVLIILAGTSAPA